MIHLRDARTTDAGSVGAILSEFARDTPWMPQLHTQAEDIAHAGVLIDRGWVTVAEHEGAVVGRCACDGNDFDALFVVSFMRGKGVGAALLKLMQERESELELWTFEANAGAQRFYLRHGFKEITRTDGTRNDEQLPDIQYKWQREAS